MLAELREELSLVDITRRKLKQFIFLICGALIFLNLWQWWQIETLNYHQLFLTLILLGIGLFFPQVMTTIYRVWIAVAIIIGFVMSRIILTLIFLIIFTTISVISKLSGKQFLDLHTQVSSYWIKKKKHVFSKEELLKQF